jgi:peptide/nickel transport system permease protein
MSEKVHHGRFIRAAGWRALRTIGLAAFVLITVFLLFTALPADPARSILGSNASDAAVQSFEREHGLDQPLSHQFVDYISGLIVLDFGTSFVTQRSVGPRVWRALIATLNYVGAALALSMFLSILLTTLASWQRHVRDAIMNVTSAMTSLPALVYALGVGLLLLGTGVLNFIPSTNLQNLFSAAIALSIYPTCSLSQILIEKMEATRREGYVRTLKSIGRGRRYIHFRVVMRRALLPWVAQLSNVAAGLVAGSIVIELVFSLPGLGQLILQSVLQQDYPMVQAIVLISVLLFIVIDACSEVVYSLLNPEANKVPEYEPA